jgi:hypothetical protein
MTYSDEKEFVSIQKVRDEAPSTSFPESFSDKQVLVPTEKIAIPPPSHDGLQVDQRSESAIEAVPSSLKSPSEVGQGNTKSRKIFRFLATKKGLGMLSVLLLIIIAVVVAAAVATTVAHHNANKGSGSATPSAETQESSTPTDSSNPSTTPTTDAGFGSYTCPESNGTSYNTSYYGTNKAGTFYYLELCNVDWPAGDSALGGNSGTNQTVTDLSIVLADSMEQCMNQCALYSVEHDDFCMAVTYGANKTLAMERDGVGGNCRLKNARSTVDKVDNSGQLQAAFIYQMTG